MGATLLVLFLDFLIIGISAHINDWPKLTVFQKALISSALGSVIFGINTGVVTFITEYAPAIPSVFYGIAAGLTPVIILLVIRWFVKPVDQSSTSDLHPLRNRQESASKG